MSPAGPAGRWAPSAGPTRSLRSLAALVIVLLALAGCSIATDAEPRDIPIERRNAALRQEQIADIAAEGEQRIYLVSQISPRTQLRTVSRDATTPDALLEQLFEGPNTDERSAGLTTALPPDLGLASPVRVEGGVITVNLDSELATAGSDLPAAVAQIVFTASQLPGIERVQIRVNDEGRTWPDASGAEQSVPLSVYDFPEFAESYAPAYPVIPPPPRVAPPPSAPAGRDDDASDPTVR